MNSHYDLETNSLSSYELMANIQTLQLKPWEYIHPPFPKKFP